MLMNAKEFELFREDFIDCINSKINRVSRDCEFASTELRDIQNMMDLLRTDVKHLVDFIRETCVEEESRRVWVVWGHDNELREYAFKTECEVSAFLHGINEAQDHDYWTQFDSQEEVDSYLADRAIQENCE
jgi:hypothetical protein